MAANRGVLTPRSTRWWTNEGYARPIGEIKSLNASTCYTSNDDTPMSIDARQDHSQRPLMADSPDEERMRWAEATTILRIHGDDAPRWIAERIGALALSGDAAGIARLKAIAARCEAMLAVRSRPPS